MRKHIFNRLRFFSNTAILAGIFTIFLLANSLPAICQPSPEAETLYKILDRQRLHTLIRDQLRPLMQEKKLDPIVVDARLSTFVYLISERLAAEFKTDTDFQKAMEGDNLALVKLQSPENRSRWENTIIKILNSLPKAGGYEWRSLVAHDFGDRILVFNSDISIKKDGTILVAETIIIYNGSGQRSTDIDYSVSYEPNNDIQRGIVRDFPTKYLAKDGFWQHVGFKLKSVTLNGRKTGYRTENLDNGIRIMVGDADVVLDEGIYEYRLTYETNSQIIYHTDKDEFYWNVNGNGWVFFADSVSCTIQFPVGSRIGEFTCYTGFQASTEQNCNPLILDDSTIQFSATNRLEPWQGLTVAAAIPKGILDASPARNFFTIIRDNYGISILGSVLLVLLLFYYLIWNAKGRDPKKGTIFPQLEPPEDLTPADVGYISEQKYGSHLFAATLVDMAVNNYLRIEIETKKVIIKWTIYKFLKPEGKAISDGSHLLSLYGFRPGDLHGKEIESGKYDPSFKANYDALGKKLEERFKIRRGKTNAWHGLFVRNDGYTGCGGVIAFGALIFGVFYVVTQFSLNILAVSVLLVLAILIIHGIFVRIMSAYTPKGRQIADHIEGFKMYLETAEQKLYEHFTPPEKSLELFEKYLPYAIALKVENAWANKFDSIVQKAIEAGYQPSYYSGRDHVSFSRGFSMGDMSRGISAGLSSTVASASTPPSSSGGGSSGGGSSGGGGGGGGGGGW